MRLHGFTTEKGTKFLGVTLRRKWGVSVIIKPRYMYAILDLGPRTYDLKAERRR